MNRGVTRCLGAATALVAAICSPLPCLAGGPIDIDGVPKVVCDELPA